MLYLDMTRNDSSLYPIFKSPNIRSFNPKDVKNQHDRTTVRYHYTSASAMRAILNSNNKDSGSVSFTDSRYMNDRSEHLFFVKCLLRFMEDNRQDYPFCQEVINNLLLKKHDVDDYISLRVTELEETELDAFTYTNSRHFLFCLSKNNDSLHMWNYYIRNGNYQGYNIGIKLYPFLKYFDNGDMSDEKSPIRFFCGDVLYTRKKQDNEIKALCKKIEEFGFKSADRPYSLQLGMGLLWSYIECYGLFFKDSSFSDEQEYRMVIQFVKPLAGTSVSSYFKSISNSNIEYTFFERNGVLVPCLNVPLARDAVDSITMAPIMESYIVSESIHEYLENNGYTNVAINESKIPIRY